MNGRGELSGSGAGNDGWRRMPDVPPTAAPFSPTATILASAATVAALYLGRDVLIPLALAILLSFALGPLVTWLHRRGVPRVPAVLAVMLLLTLLLAGFAALVAGQLTHLAQQLPTYETNLRLKAREVAQAAPGRGIIDRTADFMRDFGREIDRITTKTTEQAAPSAAPGAAQSEPSRPIPVEIHEPPPTPLQALAAFVGPMLQPVATAGIVLVFIVFVLLQREDLRDRMIRLFGHGDVHRATAAISDAAKRIGRYLLMQLVVNVLYGLPVAIGLFLIGVPNALLWGMLATVLRFIPYLGPILAAVFPIALSFAVDVGWSTPLLTIALFIGLELFTNNVLEPWLYGSSTGLSPLAIIVAAVFWTTLWGPVGLLLATPLTVCLVVLGRYVPQLQFFEVLLGDQPVLAPEVKFYQRVLAGDPHEAEELAEDLLEERSLEEICDGVILRALVFADQDRQRGALDAARVNTVGGHVIEIVEDLAEPVETTPQTTPLPVRVLCVGARTKLDVAAAAMLAQLLVRRGATAEVVEAGALLHGANLSGPWDVVCLSCLDVGTVRHARRLILRIRARLGRQTRFCVGLWGGSAQEVAQARARTQAEELATTLAQAVQLALQQPDEPVAASTASPGASAA
ncbi:MAG: AI-2E family transporter [Geminicoccaceae bacterium]